MLPETITRDELNERTANAYLHYLNATTEEEKTAYYCELNDLAQMEAWNLIKD